MKDFIKYSLLALGLLLINQGKAQDIYATQKAILEVHLTAGDTALKLTTKSMLVLLDYEDASLEISVDPSTFFTGNDSLDDILKGVNMPPIKFTGQLGLDFINTTGHPPLSFDVYGVLESTATEIGGKGELAHISNRGIYSCVLTLKFRIKPEDLGLNLEGLNIGNDIRLEIVQVVLNRTADQ